MSMQKNNWFDLPVLKVAPRWWANVGLWMQAKHKKKHMIEHIKQKISSHRPTTEHYHLWLWVQFHRI